jgi:Protein of unknown function (DUF2917)
MMYAEHTFMLPTCGDSTLSAGGARLLQTRRSGRLVVAAGRAWLTRQGDLDDHVLSAGETLRLRADDQVVVEPWVDGTSVWLAWRSDQPRARVFRGVEALIGAVVGLRAAAWRGLGGALVAAGARLLAWARSAEASASRAQGSISRGESSASSGALQ